MTDNEESLKLFGELLEIMTKLRSEKGCPWDREQNRISLKPYILEEAYEVAEAIEDGSASKILDELGDLFFQIIFQAKIGQENQEFTITDILANLREKMVRRHPHVFGTITVKDSKEVVSNWEKIKRNVESAGVRKPVLSGVPRSLPTLLRAQRLQEKAATVGFDWKNPEEIIRKIEEETEELRAALKKADRNEIEEELGDLMFSVINVGRFLKFNTDEALRKTIEKFVFRFQEMENNANQRGISLFSLSIDELETLWQNSKKIQR